MTSQENYTELLNDFRGNNLKGYKRINSMLKMLQKMGIEIDNFATDERGGDHGLYLSIDGTLNGIDYSGTIDLSYHSGIDDKEDDYEENIDLVLELFYLDSEDEPYDIAVSSNYKMFTVPQLKAVLTKLFRTQYHTYKTIAKIKDLD